MVVLTLFICFAVAFVDFWIEGRLTIVSRSYGFIVPIFILLPHVARFFSGSLKKYLNTQWLRLFDWYAFFIIAINIPGSIYFHKIGVQYDRFIHFGSALFAFLVFLLFLITFQVRIRKKRAKRGALLLFSFVVLFLSLFLWEGYQYTVDGVFGSKLFYDVAQDISVDVWEDILFGLVGLIFGVMYANYSFNSLLSIVTRGRN